MKLRTLGRNGPLGFKVNELMNGKIVLVTGATYAIGK